MRDDWVTVAAVQLSSGVDRSANVDSAVHLVREAVGRGATYVQLPEYFNYLGPAKGYAEASEPITGPTVEVMATLARRLDVVLHLGSMLETAPASGRPYNTSVIIGPTGQVIATYRKVHLFDVDVPDAIAHQESDAIEAGDALVMVRLAQFDLGLSVCFDLRFGEQYRSLCAAGAQVLAIPAAFNAITGRAHWEVLVRARAIENLAFVIAAAQVGTTSEGIATFGHSMIVDPWGEVLAKSTTDGPEVLVASLDLDQVARRRHQIAVSQLRRPEVYEAPVRVIES